MSAETVPVNEEVKDEQTEQPVEQEATSEVATQAEETKEERVPLSALQKERRKRQEIEQELRWHKELAMQQKAAAQPEEPDVSQEEAATKKDLGNTKAEVIRAVQENIWIKQNPERAAEVDEKLTEFLKQRPNLASAIKEAANRYEEAWTLMEALTPKQKAALRPAPLKKDSPGNPSGVPKAAALNQAVDVMTMSDSEFAQWRQSKRKRR